MIHVIMGQAADDRTELGRSPNPCEKLLGQGYASNGMVGATNRPSVAVTVVVDLPKSWQSAEKSNTSRAVRVRLCWLADYLLHYKHPAYAQTHRLQDANLDLVETCQAANSGTVSNQPTC